MKYPGLYQAFRKQINLSPEAYLDLEKRLVHKSLKKKTGTCFVGGRSFDRGEGGDGATSNGPRKPD